MHNATAKVAFAAYLHDLGKFAERARLEVPDEKLQTHIQLYCPVRFADGKPTGHYTHKHAAYTALAWDILEKHAPDLVRGDMYPFASRQGGEDKTDSLLNASAMHHKPDTFLQWIIATADRVASGFEREEFERYNQADDNAESAAGLKTGKNHYQARLLTLFEQVGLKAGGKPSANADLAYCYPLKSLSPESIFPQKREKIEPSENRPAQQEYRELWQAFLQGLEEIPATHRSNWHLWLDHFDTLWQSYTQAIPAATAFGVKPEVSLYDHSKTTAALAAALWRWHEAARQTDEAAAAALKSRSDWDEQKILLIQGDFFGIQNFIFASGSQTNKHAAKLLRGRSFQVSLFAELAALKVLRACDLPPTSQILNAAGKFMIVAPNTAKVREAVEKVRVDINQWFLQHSYGQVALGLATQAASCNDFVNKEGFKALMKQSFEVLEQAKLQRFDLTASAATVLSADYHLGVCCYNQQLPGEELDDNGNVVARLSRDQIYLGSELVRKDRLMVLEHGDSITDSNATRKLSLPLFDFTVAFTEEQEISGKFGAQAKDGSLLRFWDFSLPGNTERPDNTKSNLWQGYARRYINAYVPRFSEGDSWLEGKYTVIKEAADSGEVQPGNPKTFSHLACEERHSEDGQSFIGKVAIATLKGDVDNLGSIFQQGLSEPTFAKMAALSRQMNHFFSLWLPACCAEKYPNTYTVFAGGDDFFLIGPWLKIQQLAAEMHACFSEYVAGNKGITFSAGIAVTKPDLPLAKLSAYAEEALEAAKNNQYKHEGKACLKNSICVYSQAVAWPQWAPIQTASARIDELKQSYGLSTGFIYSMLQFSEQAEKAAKGDVAASMWRSRFAYRTRRYVNDNKHIGDKNNAYKQLTEAFYQNGIEKLGAKYRIALFNHFYLLRAR
ncbi:type III-A CRISPR-associated protein Cas10/Csm1 [Uruburuella testudinis]|uniref:CRISPR system single-strand-specific deoxyribonuclease Cas10/Csm1 (subtype III-A) n=1 Tax=Uruburuella testudinis TaxID=1282863 RepID=A0ABY4DQB1_9NEIS|nr:type III-A CRISPR-associated protein Cas10/Csm1 [Uruburuella testudinis]UOO81243.1 type III-A CRISPR-associated protein Cas10/Csm1 [Uruburuella testudinis]